MAESEAKDWVLGRVEDWKVYTDGAILPAWQWKPSSLPNTQCFDSDSVIGVRLL